MEVVLLPLFQESSSVASKAAARSEARSQEIGLAVALVLRRNFSLWLFGLNNLLVGQFVGFSESAPEDKQLCFAEGSCRKLVGAVSKGTPVNSLGRWYLESH